MPLFRRLFDFQKSQLPQLEHRLSQRFTAGRTFPLQAAVYADGHGWPGRVQNLSATGAGLLLGHQAAPRVGQVGRLHLELDQYELELNTRIAHVEAHAEGWLCGLGLSFDDFTAQKTHLQLLQPIALGSSLRPVAAGPVAGAPATCLVYSGESGAELSVWRAGPPGAGWHHFEFALRDYLVRAAADTRGLEVLPRPPGGPAGSAPPTDLNEDTKAEIRQLFRWIVPNLPESMPADVRVFLQGFAH